MTDPVNPESESLRFELQQAIGTFQTQMSLLIQMAGFFIAADSALLAYGLTQRRAGILLLASFMPAIMLGIYIELRNSSIPVIYVAITLERKLHLRDAPLVETFALSRMSRVFAMPTETTDMADPEFYASMLRSPQIRKWFTRPSALMICFIFAAQLGWFLVSLLVYHYPFM